MGQRDLEQPTAPLYNTFEDGTRCAACKSRQSAVRLPCGHESLCEPCAKEMASQSSACPTCKQPFSTYKPVPRISNFKAPIPMTIPTLQSTKEKITSNETSCCQVVCLLIVAVLALAVALSPIGLGVFEAWLYSKKKHASCDHPLANWVLACSIFHLLILVEACLCQKKKEEGKGGIRATQVLLQLGNLVLMIVGSTFVYGSHNCDKMLFDFSWWIITITWSFMGLAFSLVCCASFCATLSGSLNSD
eukprot:c9833_g1_i1.p1 GENE.c9833_g1_i1~~c9833_g1_i1.p1  ORF type:complete len:247 (-),score=55.81 c9833_g1_i1:167-907(-)